MLAQLADCVAHDARLAVIVDGYPVRVSLAGRASRLRMQGRVVEADAAERELEGPSYPWPLQYLDEWSAELYGRSGFGTAGIAPLEPAQVHAWAALKSVELQPHEFDALLLLDSVRRDPPAEVNDG